MADADPWEDDGYECPETLARSEEKRRELTAEELAADEHLTAPFGRMTSGQKQLVRLSNGRLAIEFTYRTGGAS